MSHKKIAAGALAVSLALGATGVAVAARTSAAPKRVTIKAIARDAVKPNRYFQDGLRWNRDVYTIRSGGTLHIVNLAASEGPHTFTVVRKKDLPRTVAQVNNCKVCFKYAKAHGANPQSNAPPKFQYLENGVGQNTPPKVDRVGDSGVTGPGRKGEFINLKVTAKPGTVLHFMCLIHPWMQAVLKVVK